MCSENVSALLSHNVLLYCAELLLGFNNKNSTYGQHSAFRTCVIQEYQFYELSVSQYHGCCQNHESISIP